MLSTALAVAVFAGPGTIVMVHGAGGGGWEYDFWKPVFQAAKWKVVARDLTPANGGLESTTVNDYVTQVASWAKGAKRPLVLVGASIGGPLCLKAAESLNPDAIVLVNSVAPAGLLSERRAASYPAIVRWANGPIENTRSAMPDSDEKTVRWAWKRWRDESGAVLNGLVEGVPVKKAKCPILVVLGGKDADVPPSIGRQIAEEYGADVHEYAETSHVGPLMGRRAKETAKATLAWVQSQLR